MNHIFQNVEVVLAILNDQNKPLIYQLYQVYQFHDPASILEDKRVRVADKDSELLLIFEVLHQYSLQFEHHILRYIEFFQIYQ